MAAVPALSEIVSDLKENDAALHSFRAAVTFTLESPKLKSIQRFPSGTVAYRRPDELYVDGKNTFGATLFKLTSQGANFVIEFPTVGDVDDRYYCSTEAADFAHAPFAVAPADIAREMFMPIDWNDEAATTLHITHVDADTGETTLEMKAKGALLRRIVVAGKPWNIVHNTLVDRDGSTLSDTVMSNYIEGGGARVPAHVDAAFPKEATRIAFDLRNVRINANLPDSMFAIHWPAGQ